MKLQDFNSRCKTIRKMIIEMISVNNRGHYGSAMSLVELLVYLYDDFLNYNPKKINLRSRDRLILSKGHGCLALYSILADKGFFPKKELKNFQKFNSILPGHPEIHIPGVEASTGSLGHGLSVGVGMAKALKLNNNKSKVLVILGDGELNEGSIWEAALHASKHKLNNLFVIVDYNKLQSYGKNKYVCPLEPLGKKWSSFGFHVEEFDGHNYKSIKKTLRKNINSFEKPCLFLSHSIKGKGYEKSENNPTWHHKNFDSDEIKILKKEFLK